MSKILLRPKRYVRPKRSWDVVEMWSSDVWTSVAATSWAQKLVMIAGNPARIDTKGESLVNSNTTLRVKHIQIDCSIPITDPGVVVRVAAIFFPDGYNYNVAGTLADAANIMTTVHPEWVMAAKTATMNEGGGNLCIHLNSGRLERKLKANDSIRLMVAVVNPTATQTGYIRYTAVCRYAVSTN